MLTSAARKAAVDRGPNRSEWTCLQTWMSCHRPTAPLTDSDFWPQSMFASNAGWTFHTNIVHDRRRWPTESGLLKVARSAGASGSRKRPFSWSGVSPRESRPHGQNPPPVLTSLNSYGREPASVVMRLASIQKVPEKRGIT